MSFQILDHEILPGEFIVIAVVVDPLIGLEMHFVHDFIDHVSLSPHDVPVFSGIIFPYPSVSLH